MKPLFRKLSLALVLTLTVMVGYADRQDVEKKKTIDKTFDVSGETRLSVRNSFGRVHINSWDKPSITVHVDVIARRRTEERAQETLDKIEIKIEESSGEISFVTDISGSLNNQNSENFEINYTINMPGGNPLEMHNSFGETYIADRTGENDIKISYGDLKLNKLMGKTDIKISFSDGSVELVKTGEIEVKYSDVKIAEVGVVRVDQGFSELTIDRAETISLESKYGDMNIGAIQGIKGNIGFSGFSVEKVYKEADLETSYGNIEIDAVGRDFSTVRIEGKFGNIRLGLGEVVNASFDVETKFCDLNYSSVDLNMDYKVSGDFDAEYRGTIGNGSGGKITVRSGYGDVTFR